MRKLLSKLRTRCGNAASESASEMPFETSLGRRLVAPSPQLCAITDVGLRRKTNEDDFFLSPEGRFWIVADGMGGEACGDVASRLAIQAMSAILADCDAASARATQRRLLEAFDAAQVSVLDYAQSHPDSIGMGAAALAAVVTERQIHICYAGDVRCYVMSDRTLELITQDHSSAERLVQMGFMTREQARLSPQQGVLEQAIGLARGFRPTTHSHRLKKGDLVLVCSDGLWESIPEGDLSAILGFANRTLRQRATDLVDRANGAGGNDNMTVVLYECA
ncbi:MAG: protein phosphatase 2C domain-containing protein [Vicinamibacterales bacterium]